MQVSNRWARLASSSLPEDKSQAESSQATALPYDTVLVRPFCQDIAGSHKPYASINGPPSPWLHSVFKTLMTCCYPFN